MSQQNRQLTERQRAFAQEYVENGRHASDAYRSVYATAGMKTGAISHKAARLLKNERVRALIDELGPQYEQIAEQQFEMDAGKLLATYIAAAAYDPIDYLAADDEQRPALERLPKALRCLMEPKFVTRTGAVIWVPPSREAARDALGKIFDLTNRLNVEQSGQVEVLHKMPDFDRMTDPVEAMNAFEAFRKQLAEIHPKH